MKKNIFQIGRQVVNESFIGRNILIKDLQNRFLTGNTYHALSVVGLARVGKSSLVFNALNDEMAHNSGMIYVHIVLTECESYIAFLKNIVSEIENELSYFFEDYDEYLSNQFSRVTSCPNSDDSYPILNSAIKNILRVLSKDNRPVLLIIDEFDGAKLLFCGKKPYFEFLRTIFSSAKYKVSTILISRRSLHIIEECSPENSTFHGVFNRLTLHGFDDNDMQDYFSVLSGYNISLTNEQKERLRYYCGRLPYLLSMFGFHLVKAKTHGNISCNIKDVFSDNSPQIMKYYEDIRYQLEHDNQLDKLIDFIFNARKNISDNDIDVLNAIGLLNSDSKQCYTVCPNFTDYIRQSIANKHEITYNKQTNDLIPHIDVLILISTVDEEKAIVENDDWIITQTQKGISYYIKNEGLTFALVRGYEMGETDAALVGQTFIDEFSPKYIAMAGFCAGQEGKVQLGDIIVPSMIYRYGEGKQISEGQLLPEIDSFKLDPKWRQIVERFGDRWRIKLKLEQPINYEYERFLFVTRLLDNNGSGIIPKNIWSSDEMPNLPKLMDEFKHNNYIIFHNGQISITDDGMDYLHSINMSKYWNGYYKDAPSTKVGVLATGENVQQWSGIFDKLSQNNDRRTIALDMEAHAIGKLSSFNRIPYIIAKGVGDFAQDNKAFDNRYIPYSCHASCRFIIEFFISL